MAPKRKSAVSRPSPSPKRPRTRGRGRGRGASSSRGEGPSQAPSPSELRSKRRNDPALGNPPSSSVPRNESSTEEEEVESQLPIRYFGSDRARDSYYERYSKRKLHETRKVDFLYMSVNKLKIEEWFDFQKWSDLLREDTVIYPTLVRIFHSNFDGVNLRTLVKGVTIDFEHAEEQAYETLGIILGVPYEEEDLPDEVDMIKIWNDLSPLSTHTAATLTIKARDMIEEARIIRVIMAESILPKVGSKDQVTKKEAEIIWKIMNMKKINLPKELFSHIIACNKERHNLSLPYGGWLTGVFKFFGVDYKSEASYELKSKKVIGETTLKLMEIDVLAIKVAREDEERRAAQVAAEDAGQSAHHSDTESPSPDFSFQRREPGPSDQTPTPPPSQPSPSPPTPIPTPIPTQSIDPTISTLLRSFQTSMMSELTKFQSIIMEELKQIRFKLSTLENNQHNLLRRVDDLRPRVLSSSSSSSSSDSSSSQPSVAEVPPPPTSPISHLDPEQPHPEQPHPEQPDPEQPEQPQPEPSQPQPPHPDLPASPVPLNSKPPVLLLPPP